MNIRFSAKKKMVKIFVAISASVIIISLITKNKMFGH